LGSGRVVSNGSLATRGWVGSTSTKPYLPTKSSRAPPPTSNWQRAACCCAPRHLSFSFAFTTTPRAPPPTSNWQEAACCCTPRLLFSFMFTTHRAPPPTPSMGKRRLVVARHVTSLVRLHTNVTHRLHGLGGQIPCVATAMCTFHPHLPNHRALGLLHSGCSR